MTAPDGPGLHLSVRPTAPCNRCTTDLATTDLLDGLRCVDCTDAAYRRLVSWSEPALRTPASSAHPWASPTRSIPLPTFLIALAVGFALWLGVVALGQQVMCAAHDDALRYCPGFQNATPSEESRP